MTDVSSRLDGRTAIVVGAAHGIGRAIALRLAGAGAAVVACDVDGAAAADTARAIAAAGGRGLARATDVTRAAAAVADVAAAEAAFGGVDALVYGAATLEPSGTVLELDEADWRRTLDVNLTGAYLWCRAAIPALARRGGGSIVLIASQLGHVATPGRPAYCATKGALLQLGRALALDHARDGVRVNTLSPGAVETRRLEHRFGGLPDARAALAPLHPLGRLGQPHEIADAALFLVSPASAFMTGSDLLVDGGYTAR